MERQLRMPRPTVSKHLRVLRQAGFLESTVDEQRRLCRWMIDASDPMRSRWRSRASTCTDQTRRNGASHASYPRDRHRWIRLKGGQKRTVLKNALPAYEFRFSGAG